MNFELESAYIYATMAAYVNSLNMKGVEHFFEHQAKEDVEHAERFKKFLQETGYKIKYRALNPGEGKFVSIDKAFKKALAHEKI